MNYCTLPMTKVPVAFSLEAILFIILIVIILITGVPETIQVWGKKINYLLPSLFLSLKIIYLCYEKYKRDMKFFIMTSN